MPPAARGALPPQELQAPFVSKPVGGAEVDAVGPGVQHVKGAGGDGSGRPREGEAVEQLVGYAPAGCLGA